MVPTFLGITLTIFLLIHAAPGDPASIHFFERVGLDYVSCSPFRVPVARLAAAQAALSNKR